METALSFRVSSFYATGPHFATELNLPELIFQALLGWGASWFVTCPRHEFSHH